MNKLSATKLPLRLIMMIALILLSTISVVQSQGQPIFRIGILDHHQGSITQGAQLAVQELNAAGGVRGADGTAFNLELVVHSVDNLELAVNNINQASVIAVLGPHETDAVLTGMSTLQRLNMPILTPATGDTIILQDTAQHLFRLRAQDVLQGQALANYLIRDLGVSSLAAVQLDIESTASIVGFSSALAAYNITPQPFLMSADTNISQIANRLIQSNIQVAVTYGAPDLARQLFIELRANNWAGQFVYNRSDHELFTEALPVAELDGIIGVSTWTYGIADEAADTFLSNYVRTFGAVPDAIAAASYDGIYMLAAAIQRPGDLITNLTQLDNIEGVQGILTPARLSRGEFSNNTVITRRNAFGGFQALARYAGTQRLPQDDPSVVLVTETPIPTATPDGVVLTIKSNVQNIRSGPGLDYDILGQMREGEQAKVIGATIDYSWMVIQYRGQNGWLATYLLDVFGDQNTLSIVAPPPTPTPAPATATPTPSPSPDIVIISATPTTLTLNVPFNVTVTVRNQGTANAGSFAIAANFPPDAIFSAVNIPGLAAGQQTTVLLNGTFTSTTGPQSVVIVADLNMQVDEGAGGEANNDDFIFSYTIDRTVLNTGTLIMNQGGTLNLEGAGAIDLLWDVSNKLKIQNGATMYIMSGISSMTQIHYDLINPALASGSDIDVALLPNAYIGVITSEGNRGAIHIDSVTSGGPLTVTYRVYSP